MLTEYSAIFTHSVENKRKCLTVCRALLVLLLLLLSLLSVDMYMIYQQHHSHGWNVQRSFEMCVSVSLLSWLAIFCLFVFVNVKINEINEHNTFHGVCVFFAGFLFLVDLEYVCIELRLRNKYKYKWIDSVSGISVVCVHETFIETILNCVDQQQQHADQHRH